MAIHSAKSTNLCSARRWRVSKHQFAVYQEDFVINRHQ